MPAPEALGTGQPRATNPARPRKAPTRGLLYADPQAQEA